MASDRKKKQLSIFRPFLSPEIRLQAKQAYLEGASADEISERFSMPVLSIRHYIATEWGADKWALAKSEELDRVITEAPRATKHLRESAMALTELVEGEIIKLSEAGPSKGSATQIRRLTESLSQLTVVLEKSTGFTELTSAATHDASIDNTDSRPVLGTPVVNVVVNPPSLGDKPQVIVDTPQDKLEAPPPEGS